jgi:hypothetical protein
MPRCLDVLFNSIGGLQAKKYVRFPLLILILLEVHLCRDERLEFEDTNGVIRIHTLKKNKQHHGQKKKYKRRNNDLQNIHIKL